MSWQYTAYAGRSQSQILSCTLQYKICLGTFNLNFLGTRYHSWFFSFRFRFQCFKCRFPEQVPLALLTARVVQLAWGPDPEAQASAQVSSYCKDYQDKNIERNLNCWNSMLVSHFWMFNFLVESSHLKTDQSIVCPGELQTRSLRRSIHPRM